MDECEHEYYAQMIINIHSVRGWRTDLMSFNYLCFRESLIIDNPNEFQPFYFLNYF